MGDKENEEIWKILQKEIRIKSEDQDEKVEKNVNEHSSEPIGTEESDTKKEGIEIFIDELEKRRQMANSGSIVLSGNGDNSPDDGKKDDDDDDDDNNDDGKTEPPFDPRDHLEDRRFKWFGKEEKAGKPVEIKNVAPESGKENIIMRKRLKIRQTEDHVKVRFFVGEEEFVGMSVNKGSSNAITFGGTTIYLDGDETVLEM